MLNQKKFDFDVLFICLYFIVHTLILFKLEIPLILTIYGHLAGNSNSLISHNLVTFKPIWIEFSLKCIIFKG